MAVTAEVIPEIPTHPVVARANKLLEANKTPEAVLMVEEHLVKNPDDAHALTVLASGLKKLNKPAEAYYVAQYAVKLRPDRPETWNAVGHTAQQLWRQDEALSAYRKALQRAKTDDQKALYNNNIASVYLDNGEFRKAEGPVRDSLKIKDDRMARHNLGLCLMAQHKWEEGWEAYSASIGTSNRLKVKYRNPPEDTWDGNKGQTIVVYGEQGLGDEICAASMLPDVIRDSKKVIIDCDVRLEGLFKRSFPEASVYGTRWAKPEEGRRWKESPDDLDASVAAFEVGKFYRKKDEDFPGTPYLKPDPERVTMWRALFEQKKKPVIGISWTGGTWHNAGQYRNVPLKDWKPIFDSVDAHWVSLQYKDASREIEGTPVVQYPFGTLTRDYDDTAALVASCDLVISMQTSVVHLAGALGQRTWSMIPTTSQWRYGESGESIPWYQSVKLYRQGKTWEPTIKKIAEDARALFA